MDLKTINKRGRPNLKNTTEERRIITEKYKIKLESLYETTKFLEEVYSDLTYKQRSWHYNKQEFKIQKCICGNPKVFKEKRYKYCSRECTRKAKLFEFESTCIERYGVKTPFQNKEIKDKIKSTCMQKYGLSNGGTSGFNYKSYTLPSGRIIKLQGFENKALDIILKTYNEFDLLYGPKEINDHVGIIRYNLDGTDRKYFPDFYIKSINTIIEVKSTWTFKIRKEMNELKKQACLDKGLNFEFLVF